jgi:hypothetical protein
MKLICLAASLQIHGRWIERTEKYERPVAWGTTGLPYEPAWVWGIEALGCVGRGFDERLGRPPAGFLDSLVGALGRSAAS